jgi:hypothetical protein
MIAGHVLMFICGVGVGLCSAAIIYAGTAGLIRRRRNRAWARQQIAAVAAEIANLPVTVYRRTETGGAEVVQLYGRSPAQMPDLGPPRFSSIDNPAG